MVNSQLLFVIGGGASRNLFKDAAPKAHPTITNNN
jgi:hypothetical protein